MATILITGGTGMIGRELVNLLTDRGHAIIIATRNPKREASNQQGVSFARWDIKAQTIEAFAIEKADYIIHLAGAGVADKRWSKKRKKEIVESRTQSSALLVNALKTYKHTVKAVVSASAIGWYGPDPAVPNPHPFEENANPNEDFLGETCRLWEESISPVEQLGIRLVKLRTGIVLSDTGGALKEFLKPLRFGIAAILGSGKQIVSWIHVDDLCRIYLKAIDDEQMSGAYNAVAPKPVSNKTLTLDLAKAVKNKFFIPMYVPSFVLKMALGEMSIEVLKSATVSANKIRSAGFNFVYPTIEAAINQLVKKK
ncbi:MAG: TIGR01777 family oxidoreductase [Chitinophagaceae bacterium]